MTSVLILQLAVLGVVLESDLGRRKIGWFRVLRPVITVIAIVPFFFTSLPTAGNDLTLQGVGAVVGIALGLFSVSPWLVRVGFDPAYRARRLPWARREGKPRPASVSRSGAGYASVWTAVTLARLGFAYGAQYAFPVALGTFLAGHDLSSAALANAFVFLSVGMDLFRSAGLVVRGRRARVRQVGAGHIAASGGTMTPDVHHG